MNQFLENFQKFLDFENFWDLEFFLIFFYIINTQFCNSYCEAPGQPLGLWSQIHKPYHRECVLAQFKTRNSKSSTQGPRPNMAQNRKIHVFRWISQLWLITEAKPVKQRPNGMVQLFIYMQRNYNQEDMSIGGIVWPLQ